jgi:hypothetical protein
MKRILTYAGVTALTLASACQETTQPTTSDLALAAAFQTTTLGFSNVNSSFSSDADTGPFVPQGPSGFQHIGGPPGLGLMGGGIGPDFAGDFLFNAGRDGGGPGRGFDHGPFGFDRPRPNCAFQAASGRVVCTADPRGNVTVTSSFQFKDAAGNIQQSPDSTTDYVNAQTSVTGTMYHRSHDTTVVSNSSDRTTTGLAYNSTKRISNGKSAGTETTTGTDSSGHFVAVRTIGDTTTDLEVPIQSGRPTYPTAGIVIRSMKALVTYDGGTSKSASRREVITYDGSTTAKLVITQDGVDKNCTVPLPHGRPSCS